MPRTGDDGVVHPTHDDAYSAEGTAHIKACPECLITFSDMFPIWQAEGDTPTAERPKDA